MTDNDLGDLPSLDDVMKGFGVDDMKTDKKGGGDEDFGFDLDDKPFDPFAKDDDRLENDPDRKDARKDEVVFEVADDDDDIDGDDDEFRDNRKPQDKRKQSRLQREMRLKSEARDAWSQLAKHLEQVSKDTTEAMRAEMHGRRNLAEVVKAQAEKDIERFSTDMKAAIENGDNTEATRLSKGLAEAEAIITKADALLTRYSEDKVNAFTYDPKIPDQLKNPNGGGTSKGNDWIDANSHWFRNPDKYAGEIAFARALDQQLIKEGRFKPDTDDYYNELTRRVALKFRDMEVHTIDGRVARIGERRRGGSKTADPTGSGNPSGGNQSRRPDTGKRESLNAEEQRFLRGFGIDTGNKDHLKELKANRMR